MPRPCNCNERGCRLCHLANTDPRYQQMWGCVTKPAQCVHLGAALGTTVSCPSCRGRVELKLFGCSRFGKCTLAKAVADKEVACCNGKPDQYGVHQPCEGYQAERSAPLAPTVVQGDPAKGRDAVRPLTWSYGVTTVPERRDTTLPVTLASLREAGFDEPRLFVDGAEEGYKGMGLHVTYRFPRVRTFANWTLAAWELYLRDPVAERYAIFQDDMVCVRNLRRYLDACPQPPGSYLNLYQYGAWNDREKPPAEQIGQTGRRRGRWFEAAELGHGPSPTYMGRGVQGGKGAVALVFDRAGLLALLTHRHTVERPQDRRPIPARGGLLMGEQKVDGSIVEAMNQCGYREWVHDPSLVQHIGDVSSMHSRQHPKAASFPSEKFDALELLG